MGDKKKLLVIDDEDLTREFFGKILERLGCEVICAATAKEGIELYRQHKPDAVFLDIILPDIHGGEVFEILKAVDKSTRIYIISASLPELSDLKAKNIGADRYFVKPVDVRQIRETIKELK